MYQIKLTNKEIDELIILHRSCRKDQRKADRIKTILLLNDEDTIITYKQEFRQLNSW